MFEAPVQNEDGEEVLERPKEISGTPAEQYKSLPEKPGAVLDRVASRNGLPEDLTGFIEVYEEDHPKDPALVVLLFELACILDERALESKAQEIVDLIK